MFNQAVIEQLAFYVYSLNDPRTGETFYIGKGVGNRVFNHVECAVEDDQETDKLDRIRDIIKSGNEVGHNIVRHGLAEAVAFEVEAALIDFTGMGNLTNLMGGHYSSDFGIKSSDEISAMYDSEDLVTDESVLLININKKYKRDLTEQELYDATRQAWVIGSRKSKAKYAIATYRGLTREIYQIDEWFSVERNGKTRHGFNGRVVTDEVIRNELRYKSIASFFKQGAANPIKYLNC